MTFRIVWTEQLLAEVEWRRSTDSYGTDWERVSAEVIDLREFVERSRALGEQERLMAGGFDPDDGFVFTAAQMAIALASLERQEAATAARKEQAA